MLPNQVIQKMIQDIKKASGLNATLWNERGDCLAGDATGRELSDGEIRSFLRESRNLEESERVEDGYGMFLVRDEHQDYVLAISGEGSSLAVVGRMGVSQMNSLIHAYRERNDKNRFMQELLLDNLLLVDIYNRARKLRIPMDRRRVVYVIEPRLEGENLILETLQGLFASGGDFVTAIDENRIIVVKELEVFDDYPEVMQTAKVISDTLQMEAMVAVRISYGTIVGELKEVSRSYKEADMALGVGSVFYEERYILPYNELGIGRLIHQLPVSLCDMFLKEVLKGNASDLFDEEELTTVYTFFDNNLNISETARHLYIHRNTLVYRLEKIQKKTGLDVRVFEDAMTFKIAVMVAKHLEYLRVM